MSFHFSDLWTWEGKIGRVPYALVGLIGVALKNLLDRVVGARFGRPWGFLGYWTPLFRAAGIRGMTPPESQFLIAMLTLSLPFILLGIVMTLKRLRSASLPKGFVVFFFIPFANVIFFTLLCLWPERHSVDSKSVLDVDSNFVSRVVPDSAFGSAVAAVLLTAPFAIAATLLSVHFLVQYGLGLFTAIPFCIGFASVLIYSHHAPRKLGSCILVSLSAGIAYAAGLLLFAFEGAVCIVMAAPIGILLASIGSIAAYNIQRQNWGRRTAPVALSVILFALPGFMGAEKLVPRQPSVFSVRTAIEINAPPGRVWQQVIAFTKIPAPHELLFRAGIAYPVRAEMHGSGVGAERHCVFSTGAFVEPIQVWDEPRLLTFSVTSNPPPMEEWTPYPKIDPPHLHGFLVSSGGQFLLTPLPGGRTRLEGTTWYRHSMWPESYWRVWSDYIIHRIHLRVLDHIARETILGDNSASASLR